MRYRKLWLAVVLAGLAMITAVPAAPAASTALLMPSSSPPPASAPRGPRIYELPFPGGSSFIVCQGNNHAGGTHTGLAAYAWDFCMPIGSPVTAARGGTVRTVRQDSKRGGWGPAFANDANYIVVDHGDGTSGLYMHLMMNGARVKPGQVVQTGELLGYSGDTGWTSAPHLHFMVMETKADDYYAQSLPVLFSDVPTDGGLPLEDRKYSSGNAPLDPKFFSPDGPPPFTPFWVESFKPTTLWSGSDARAIQFGPAGQWQFFQVVAPQDGPRLKVLVGATGATAFVPTGDVGPSGPPPDQGAAPAAAARPDASSAEVTPAANIAPTASKPATAEAGAAGQITISAGDTLFAIAREQHTTVAELVAVNDLSDANSIRAGQSLKLR